MNLVSVEKVAKRHAEKQVLDGVSFGIDDGDRVGVIGVNGSGKSTLLRVVAGLEEPDAGRVVTGSGVRVQVLAQDPTLRAARTVAELLGGDRQAEALLDRMGIRDLTADPATLSGGQRKRVALACALAADAEVLVLDEPTNHLDVDVVEWLEGRLLSRRGALLLVTHDRYLLDRLATRVFEVHRGQLYAHAGGYADYLRARAVREEQAAATERRRRNRMRTELAWLRRGPQARTSKARYRVEQAQALLAEAPPDETSPLSVDLPSRRLGTKVSNAHRAGVRYGDAVVLRDVDIKLAPDARVGVVGPNGAGKTTLLRLLAGRLEPSTGKVVLGETVAVGWYGQDPQPLPPRQRVLDAVREVALETQLTDGMTVSAGQLLERFLFDTEAQRAYVGELSGGERRRLELLLVLATAPNLLFLDEPTNDLDLDTLGVLEEYLDVWPGALVVASHDRFFLDRVCDDLYAIEPDATLRHHPGGWSAWRAARAAEQRAAAPPETAPSPPVTRRDRARKLSFNERRELAELERALPALEARKAALTEALQRQPDDYVVAVAAGEELAAVLAELDAAETRWLELSDIEASA